MSTSFPFGLRRPHLVLRSLVENNSLLVHRRCLPHIFEFACFLGMELIPGYCNVTSFLARHEPLVCVSHSDQEVSLPFPSFLAEAFFVG